MAEMRGELTELVALATYYCKDIYLEPAERSIEVERVELKERGDFRAEGTAKSGKKSTLTSMTSSTEARSKRT